METNTRVIIALLLDHNGYQLQIMRPDEGFIFLPISKELAEAISRQFNLEINNDD